MTPVEHHRQLKPILLMALVFLQGLATAASALEVTHGVTSGDVTATSAVIWSRTDAATVMHVHYSPATGKSEIQEAHAKATADRDFTAQALLQDLVPDTLYRYDVSFGSKRRKGAAVAGLFRTAALPDAKRDVRLIWSGDLAGQRYCRRPGIGYRIFAPMTQFGADFFIANGDMIYADNDCPAQGIEPDWTNVADTFPGIGDPSVDWEDINAVNEVYRAHWRYNRNDEHFQAFLANTPQYVQWDDHEVINDFGGPWEAYPKQQARKGYQNIVAAGRQTLFDYHPVMVNAQDPHRIYRRFRRGAHLELFILDARSYRSANSDPNGPAKTMLGEAQLDWLKEGLKASTATWKLISSDVPLAVPTGSGAAQFGTDAFAGGGTKTGFEAELIDLISTLDADNIRNVVFVATDVHSAAQIRYERDYDGDGDTLMFHEFIAGPLSAIRGPAPVTLDPTLGPVMIYGEGGIFNYGTIRIEAAQRGRLLTDIRGEDGSVRPGSELVLLPE